MLAFFLLLLLLSHVCVDAMQVWRLEATTTAGRVLQEQQQPADEYALAVDFAGLVAKLHTVAPRRLQPRRRRCCTLTYPTWDAKNAACAPTPRELASKYPQLIQRRGQCNNSTVHVAFNFNANDNASFSAAFSIPGRHLDWFYADSGGGGGGEQYRLYTKSAQQNVQDDGGADGVPFACEEADDGGSGDSSLSFVPLSMPPSVDELVLHRGAHSRRRQLDSTASSTSSAITLRLAVVANTDYAKLTGNTRASALNAIAAVLSRVNGIYLRELGVRFQLVPNNDLLVCAKGQIANCNLVASSNLKSAAINAQRFIAKRGVNASSYDLGHVFAAVAGKRSGGGGGGVAGVGVLCDAKYKATGATAFTTVLGNAAAGIDHVSHELGHQLGGRHSFRFCAGRARDPTAGVEPGSGSTIMSYAGVCGKNNVQARGDSYFHAVNLPVMSEFVRQSVDRVNGCGIKPEATEMPRPRIVIHNNNNNSDDDDTALCTVPLGNFFYLNASAEAATVSSQLPHNHTLYYQWEHINRGWKPLADSSVSKFRSWKPTSMDSARYFPNLYTLTNGLHNMPAYRSVETMPKRDTKLKFRFLVRSVDNDGVSGGNFAYRDYFVAFNKSVPALKFSAATRKLLTSSNSNNASTVLFQWNGNAGGGLYPKVEILCAVNTMTLFIPPAKFNSETDIKRLDWIPLGVVPNNGSAELRVPPNLSSKMSYMIRPAARASSPCVPFDFV